MDGATYGGKGSWKGQVELNEIYQRGPKLEVDFRCTNFFLGL